MSDLTLLHLSDLHASKDANNVLDSSLADIEKELKGDKQIAVLVTGDIIHQGNETAIKGVKDYFTKLAKIVGNRIVAVYVVPGNHDKKRSPQEQWMINGYRRIHSEVMGYAYSEKATIENKDIHYLFDSKALYENKLWAMHYDAYKRSGYLKCLDAIYGAFIDKTSVDTAKEELKQNHEIAKKTYGVQKLSVNGKNLCFVLANTAWSCTDDYDERHLIFGDFQRDDLQKQTRELFSTETPFCTIMLAHHPLDFLTGKEQDKTFNSISSINTVGCVDWYLCGHIHNRSVISWSNSFHKMNTLITGFGWPETNNTQLPNSEHHYSVYRLYFDLNSVSIAVRKMLSGYQYIDDASLLLNKGSGQNKRLSSPLVHRTDDQLEIRVPLHVKGALNGTVDLFPTKPFFDIRDSVLKDFATVSASLQVELSNKMRNLVNGIVKDWFQKNVVDKTDGKLYKSSRKLFEGISKNEKNDFNSDENELAKRYEGLNGIIEEEAFREWFFDSYQKDLRTCLFTAVERVANHKMRGRILPIESYAQFQQTKTLLKNLFRDENIQKAFFGHFDSYLNTICQLLADVFCQKVKRGGVDGIARVHFRSMAIKEDESEQAELHMLNCYASQLSAGDIHDVTASHLPRNSKAKYDELLTASLSSGCPSLVYSLNQSSCVATPDKEKWVDFISVLPEIPNIMWQLDEKKSCPFLTFGVTINSGISENLLYALDYIGIDKFIGTWVKNGMAVFLQQKSLKEFCDFIYSSN